jgi:hypothetical protein
VIIPVPPRRNQRARSMWKPKGMGSIFDADHPKNGVRIPRLFTAYPTQRATAEIVRALHGDRSSLLRDAQSRCIGGTNHPDRDKRYAAAPRCRIGLPPENHLRRPCDSHWQQAFSEDRVGKDSPRQLTHAPRLVDTVTSGEVVTMRRANSLSCLPISCMNRPKPCCVDIWD